MRRKQQTRWTVLIFGIVMSLIMVGSLLTGWLLQITQQQAAIRQQRAALEPTPLPTFAPPVAVESISFEETALQANGLFTVAIPNPPDWGAIESSFDTFANRARLLLRNDLNVIEASEEIPQSPVSSAEDLNALYTDQTLSTSWRNYSSWTETARETIAEDEREYLQIDFELDFQGQTYLARQRSWTDGERVYSVRVVTPQNARDLLLFLLDNVVSSFDPVERFFGTPAPWKAYYDASLEHIIRFPDTWTVTDSAEGLPASIEAPDITLRVEATEGETVADEAAAEDYVTALPLVEDVVSVTPVERQDLQGFSVAYNGRTLEGRPYSGAVVLLNGETYLHVADLRVEGLEADLNAPAEGTPAEQYAQVLGTFSPMAGYVYASESFASAAPLVENQQPPQIPGQFGGF